MTNTISNTDDTIDSRDVIARIEELTSERDDLTETIADCDDTAAIGLAEEAKQALSDWLASEDGLELATLEKLAEEASGYAADWQYGDRLIRDSYFNEEMDKMVEDCYDFGKDLPFWAKITLNYKALQQDYTSVEFNGVTYWIR